jgi:hypothetical protein
MREFLMARGDHLKRAGGKDWADAEPPADDIEDTPRSICLRALALDPVDIIIGVLDKEGVMTVLSTFEDEYVDLGALRKMEQAVSAPSDEDGA